MKEQLLKDDVVCSKCLAANERSASVCRKCGARLWVGCQHCGARNERKARRCVACNRRLHRNWWLRRRRTVIGRFTPLEMLLVFLALCLLIGLIDRVIDNIGSPSASDSPAPAVEDSPVDFGHR
jgi:ribosomal protein L40E